jgi:DNA-binding transcriptional MocR family regulator
MRDGTLDANYPLLIDIYRRRRDAMLSALEAHMSSFGTWTYPQGGLFIWLTLDGAGIAPQMALNTTELMPQALERNVAFVPGDNFYADGGGTDAMRLNFSCMPPDRIHEGIARLSTLIAEQIHAAPLALV